jgi:hypothetical protein
MGDSITHRMDEMGGRLDELEKSISSLVRRSATIYLSHYILEHFSKSFLIILL